MITRENELYQEIRGRILHVTSLNGLRGIVAYGAIRPNPDGSLGYASWGEKDCYHCQTRNSVSVLDLKNAIEAELFDPSGVQNWVGVFCYHSPAIVLVLDSEAVGPSLQRFRCPDPIYGRYIAEAEACHPGEIPASAIQLAIVVGPGLQIHLRSKDLNSVLASEPPPMVPPTDGLDLLDHYLSDSTVPTIRQAKEPPPEV